MPTVNVISLPKVIEGAAIEYKCAIDLSAKQYRFVKVDSNNLLIACGAGELGCGILQNAPIGTTAKPVIATVISVGYSKLYAGAGINQGDLLKSDTNGAGIECSAQHDQFCAEALCNADSGDLAVVRLVRGMATQGV